jgi:hypothetical protein
MNAKGIRILDKVESALSVNLYDLLKEIDQGDDLHWSVAFFYATGDLEDGTSTTELEHQINESENGLPLTWKELIELSRKYVGLRDITIIGSKNKETLTRYAQNMAMYEACDIVIEKIESAYWEIFSKDALFIQKLATKFKQTEFLEPDFLKEEE